MRKKDEAVRPEELIDLGEPIALDLLHDHALREGAPAELLQDRVDSSSASPESWAEERIIDQLKVRCSIDLMDAEEIPIDVTSVREE